jgi:hypothetical protein
MRKRDVNEATDVDAGQQPQKKYYRSRAHCNPLSHNDGFNYPTAPDRCVVLRSVGREVYLCVNELTFE